MDGKKQIIWYVYADETFCFNLSISKMSDYYVDKFCKIKHLFVADIVEELGHFVHIWWYIEESLYIPDSVLSKEGAIE